jgi:hypothetical protein
VDHVDQALTLLTGLPAGARDAEGAFPRDSLNHRICERLVELAEHRRSFSKGRGNNGGYGPGAMGEDRGSGGESNG